MNRNPNVLTRCVAPVVLVAGAICSIPAGAALGGLPLGQSDAAHKFVRAQEPAMPGSNSSYTVQTVTLANKTTVTEFATPAGKVFALRWSGPALPDYGLILGASIDRFQQQVRVLRAAGRRGGPVDIRDQGLVVVSTGHAGSYQGYAYLESLVPATVDVAKLLNAME